jgi:glycosyltransferase involved in cell wall biosynthesis
MTADRDPSALAGGSDLTARVPDLEVTIVAQHVDSLGGMERHLTELITGLMARGHHVTVISRTCQIAPGPRLRFVRVRVPSRPFPVAYPAFAAAAGRAIRRHGRGIIHTTGAIVHRKIDVSTVHFCHVAAGGPRAAAAQRGGSLPTRLNAFTARIMSRAGERYVYSPSTTRVLVAVSRGVADELGRAFPTMASATVVIDNGVDLCAFRPDPVGRCRLRTRLGIPDAALVVAFVGGDWGRKGLRILSEAVAKVDGVHLLVVGEGPSSALEPLEGQARLHRLGRIPATAAEYSAADAFCLPSAYEAWPLVVLEAAACGLPLIITPLNGAINLVRDGVNGWVIPRDASATAEHLRILRDDPVRRQVMGAASRVRAEPYSWEAMVDRYEAMYRSLAAAAPEAK